MVNTVHTQPSQNVLPRRSHTAKAQHLRGRVWQDNPTPNRARTATTQPAPPKNGMRPTPKEVYTTRTKETPTKKRKTVHLTVWVKPVVKAELQRIAQEEGLSVSSIGAAFLEKALQEDIHTQHGALLDTIIEKAIAKHMRSYSTRIALLLVRVAFDAGQTRNLVTNILGRQEGVSQQVLEQILNSSSRAAKGKITRSTPQLEELIAEVEQWFTEGESQTNV